MRIFRRVFNRGGVGCAEIRRRGSDYLEDGLSPRRRSAIKVHLDKCGPCRSFIETLSTTISLLSGIPRATPPPSFKETILERVRNRDQGR